MNKCTKWKVFDYQKCTKWKAFGCQKCTKWKEEGDVSDGYYQYILRKKNMYYVELYILISIVAVI